MSDIPFMECPICHKNYHQSFECDHDEDDLVDRIAELEATIKRVEDNIRSWDEHSHTHEETLVVNSFKAALGKLG